MPVSSSTEHWIKPDALTINLNHFGDPDYLQVSVLAGAVVMAFKQDVIGYNAAHNYRTWPLEAANTYLETSSAYNVYARLTRSEVNARALVIYDPILRDIEGREITYKKNEETGEEKEILGEPNENFYFIFLGQLSSSISEDGRSVLREWISEFRPGSLETNEQQNDWMAILNKMFRPHYDDPLNPDILTWIEAKAHMGIAGGLTSFIDNGTLNLPSIYDGLPIDMETLYWELDENGKKIYLKAKGGEGNGSFGEIETSGEGNAITKVEVVIGGEGEADKLVFTKEKTFIDKEFLENDYYTKDYIDKTFLTKSGAAGLFVTVDKTPQDIEGDKNFIGNLMVNGMPIVYDNRGFWKLEGDLLVTGGIASFSSDTKYTPSTIMDGIVCDEATISAEGGYLHLVGETKGGISNVTPDGNGNAVTSLGLSSDGTNVIFYKGMTFAEKKYVDDNFSKKTYVDETFVTLNGDPQTIESQKNFIGGLKVNGNPIVYNSAEGYWMLDGDLIITGGLATFSSDMAYKPSSIMDAIVCDEKTITAEEVDGVKMLRVIGGGTGGGEGVDEEAVRELIESYKYLDTNAAKTLIEGYKYLDKVATINIYNSSGSSIMSYDGTTNRTLTLSKSHVGLANVENTALSTWTGNSYISKVGTITSGTWQGTQIGLSYLPTATTSAKGVASFDSSYFSVSSGKVSFIGGGVQIVSSLPSSSQRTKNTLYVITG